MFLSSSESLVVLLWLFFCSSVDWNADNLCLGRVAVLLGVCWLWGRLSYLCLELF